MQARRGPGFQNAAGSSCRRLVKFALLVGVTVVGAMPLLVLPRTMQLRQAPAQLSETGGDAAAIAHALTAALKEVDSLRSQVESGKIVANFGQKAEAIISKAVNAAGGASADLERALDGILQSLFLQQLTLVRQRVSARHQHASTADTLAKATKQFASEAQELVMPGSTWTFEHERDGLSGALEGTFRAEAALAEERARSAKTQRATIDVISKLQNQMEKVQQKAAAGRGGGGGPWVLSTSYRIPKTPLQVVGKYQQGRANIQLNLSPDKDPVKAEAGFVEGVGPANVGLSFNLGV